MQQRICLCVLLCVALLAPPADAGAWPRGKGKVFVSMLTYATEFDSYTGIYAEWGVTDRLTFGADLGRAVSGNDKAVLFLRAPVGGRDGDLKLAWEIGLGRIGGHDVIRPGLSVGRSVTVGPWHGWAALDMRSEIYADAGRVDVKSDLTLGLNLWEKTTAMLQLQAGVQQGDDPFLRLVPSLVTRIGPKHRAEFGLTQSLRGAYETGVKLGFWWDF